MTLRDLTEADIFEAKRLFDQSDVALEDIAVMLGLGATAFRDRRLTWGWGKRPSPKERKNSDTRRPRSPLTKGRTSKGGPPSSKGSKPRRAPLIAPQVDEVAPDLRTLAQRVEDAAKREIALIEERLSGPVTVNTERDARTLSSLVKSLSDLRRYKLLADDGLEGANRNDDECHPPRDLAELRADLARKLERLRANRDPE